MRHRTLLIARRCDADHRRALRQPDRQPCWCRLLTCRIWRRSATVAAPTSFVGVSTAALVFSGMRCSALSQHICDKAVDVHDDSRRGDERTCRQWRWHWYRQTTLRHWVPPLHLRVVGRPTAADIEDETRQHTVLSGFSSGDGGAMVVPIATYRSAALVADWRRWGRRRRRCGGLRHRDQRWR